MPTQLDIVYKLKEALETGNPEVAAPFMADDFAHQALPAQLGAPRRTKDQWKAHVIGINSRLKSLKFEILDTIDNPGSITLQTIAHCAFDDGEPDIPVEIVFIFKFTQDETGAAKLVSTTEFMDSLAMVKVVERQFRGILPPSDGSLPPSLPPLNSRLDSSLSNDRLGGKRLRVWAD